MVIVSESSSGDVPSSVTRTVTLKVPGPWASVGVQVKTPVFESILAPVGAPTSRLNIKLLAGRSASVAIAVKVNSVSSSIDRLPITANTGALSLRGSTVTLIVCGVVPPLPSSAKTLTT